MSAAPPSYNSVTGKSSHAHESRAQHLAHEDDGYSSSDDELATPRRKPTQDEIEETMSMADEQRELPEGWTRCFDKGSGHHFYVDTRAHPPRSIWTHPYDDDEFIKSLPDTHPANPRSTQAKEARSQYDQLMEQARRKREAKASERSTGGKLKDKLLGSSKEERDAKRIEKQARRAKEEEDARKARQKFIERRQALMKQQGLGGMDSRYYASDPYSYNAPAYPYARSSMYGGGYGGLGYPRYGYGGGYGMGYGGYRGVGMGYGGMGLGGPMLGLGAGMLLGGALF